MTTTTGHWWGYSKEHGWVMLDRSIACNKPGQTRPLLFVRCSDGVVFSEPRERWTEPHYDFAPQYLRALPSIQRQAAEESLANAQRRSDEYCANVAAEGNAIEARRFLQTRYEYFAKLGINDPGYRPASTKMHRVTHCYDCKHPLDSAVSLECNLCGWLVCGVCGACGCGYDGMS
jgi:hypothetical protein